MKDPDPIIPKRARIDETSFIRTIACLAVVLVHITASPVTTLLPNSLPSYIFTLLNRGVRFTTPTFLFLSGFTLFYRYQEGPFHYGRFLKRRFTSTLIPYSIWFMVYYLFLRFQGVGEFTVDTFLKSFFLADIYYHLYFIATISQFYLLFGFFLYAFKRWNSHLLLGISLAVSLGFPKYVSMPYSDRFFMTYLFCFSLGCYAAKNLDWLKSWSVKLRWPFFAIYGAMALYDCYLFYRYYILGIQINGYLLTVTWLGFSSFAVLSLFGFANRLFTKKPKAVKPFQTIAQSSYYIYLSHPAALWISDTWLLSKGMHSITGRALLNMVIVYGTTLFFSITYTRLKKKIKTSASSR